jgi:hypothetical protein
MLDDYFTTEVKGLSATIDETVDSIALIQEFPEKNNDTSRKRSQFMGKYSSLKKAT